MDANARCCYLKRPNSLSFQEVLYPLGKDSTPLEDRTARGLNQPLGLGLCDCKASGPQEVGSKTTQRQMRSGLAKFYQPLASPEAGEWYVSLALPLGRCQRGAAEIEY
jgi:hypothetical protein